MFFSTMINMCKVYKMSFDTLNKHTTHADLSFVDLFMARQLLQSH